ncbi:RNA polymerase sigma factor SigF [Planosporangium flavigriseum]|uniref:RNA polymerase sigma factor SigF n=1 Tax=Planosporangium flavigriseum TaxID=373681 RepID=UPI001EF25DB0|nr:RNA polymerase sigma factor SigF [Planosporangium flavigriseum]
MAASTSIVVAPAAAPSDEQARRSTAADAEAHELLTLLADLPAGGAEHTLVRERLIERFLPLAEYLAGRFRHRGEPFDDLFQVANLGLIKSVDGYDVSRGAAFASYAIPMILGELKRHFRDKGWDVRVPRRVQELRVEISKATGHLAQRLGRSPTVADLAEYLGVREEYIVEGLDSAHAYRAVSLQTPIPGNESDRHLADLVGDVDHQLESVEDREALRPLIAKLSRREQRIIALRFFGNMTQTQIAAEIGVSQMHVSRLLSQALSALRSGLLA